MVETNLETVKHYKYELNEEIRLTIQTALLRFINKTGWNIDKINIGNVSDFKWYASVSDSPPPYIPIDSVVSHENFTLK